MSRHALVATTLFFAACIETLAPPEPPTVARVPYGPRIYLRDTTGGRTGDCAQVGVLAAGTSTIAGVDEAVAHNCFVEVASGTVTVDRTEITNELFQLCKDSGACERPDPSTVEKGGVCSREADFATCPVLAVPYEEAVKVCRFIGQDLPTGIMHTVIRQATAPQSVAALRRYPFGNEDPGDCAGVEVGCLKPSPMSIDDPGTPGQDESSGAGKMDVTPNGVFDLAGGASEWAVDLVAGTPGLPWFCTAPVEKGQPCPAGMVCVKGRFKVRGEAGPPPEDRPVCVTNADLEFASGSVGAVFGGNYLDNGPYELPAGTFARTAVPGAMQADSTSTRGVRCVGVPGQRQPDIRAR